MAASTLPGNNSIIVKCSGSVKADLEVRVLVEVSSSRYEAFELKLDRDTG